MPNKLQATYIYEKTNEELKRKKNAVSTNTDYCIFFNSPE